MEEVREIIERHMPRGHQSGHMFYGCIAGTGVIATEIYKHIKRRLNNGSSCG